MSNYYYNGFILHRRSFKETGLLLDMFLREQGCVSLVLNRKPSSRSQQSNVLQPFNYLSVLYYGKNELKTLKHFESLSTYCVLQGKYLFSGFYLNELLINLLDKFQEMPRLFDAYSLALQKLNLKLPIEPILREFEFLLFEELGIGIDCFADAEQLPISTSFYYRYVHEIGFIKLKHYEEGSIAGKTIIQWQAQQWDNDELSSAKQLTRQILQHQLQGKPLKSRELFKKIRPHSNS
ncbi:MAG: DNA repair protein RecO [Pseudomonadota bacterium]